MKHLTTSVIIPTRNRLTDVLTALEALRNQTTLPNELIIIDSSDTSLQMHSEFFTKFTKENLGINVLVYQHTAPGLTYQRNVGISKATGDIIYFLDDDAVPEPTYLAAMNTIFATQPEFGGGMGSVTNMPTGKPSTLFKMFRTLFFLPRDYATGNFTLSGMPTHAYGCTEFKAVQVLGGCCMAFRAAALIANKFDETLVRYAFMEDCDISKRVGDHTKLFFNPAARLEHHNSPLARDAVVDNRAMYIKNYSYLFFKNFYPKNRLKILAYFWSIIGLFLEAIITRNKNYLKGYVKGLQNYY